MSSLPDPDYVVNPKTNRPVKKGGRIWRKLIKEGLIEDDFVDDNVLCSVEETDDTDDIIEECQQDLDFTEQAVRGRGKYAGKIVKRKKQFHEPSARSAVKKTGRKLKNREVYDELLEADDFESELERLIMAEINNPTTNKRTKATRNKKLTSQYQDLYLEESEDEYDFGSDSDSGSDDGVYWME